MDGSSHGDRYSGGEDGGAEGCQCQSCRTTWSPERFVWLSRVLGSLPDNVLE